MKIISFNVGTTHLMHFNQKIIHPTGETVQNKNNRAKLIKFNILSSVNNENADKAAKSWSCLSSSNEICFFMPESPKKYVANS